MLGWSNITIELTSASVSDFFNTINSAGIFLRNIRYVDDLRVVACLSMSEYVSIVGVAKKKNVAIRLIGKNGYLFILASFLKRPLLSVGILLWFLTVLYLPTRILFVQVDGNRFIESAEIIEAAEKCGIHFGASRRYVRSEKVKNALLSELKDLQWAGVNTSGCIATISVKERAESQTDDHKHGICSVVASRDGIISNITAIKGTPVCKVGQAVRSGQLLVSGLTDCGLSIKAEQAEAEIYAITKRYITAIALSRSIKRTALKEIDVRYSIQIGKNVVKLYKDSGIPDAHCVKIQTQVFLKLPGDYQLPVSYIKETLYYYHFEEMSCAPDNTLKWVNNSVDTYLQSDMAAGKVLHKNTRTEFLEDVCCTLGVYTCEEMISMVRTERIDQLNE